MACSLRGMTQNRTTNPSPMPDCVSSECPCIREAAPAVHLDGIAFLHEPARSLDAELVSGQLVGSPLEVAAARLREANARLNTIRDEQRALKVRQDAAELAAREVREEVDRAQFALIDAAGQG